MSYLSSPMNVVMLVELLGLCTFRESEMSLLFTTCVVHPSFDVTHNACFWQVHEL
jgi:hypothetical protein